MGNLLRRSSVILLLTVLSACASIDFDYPKSESFGLTDTGDTQLGKAVADLVAANPANQSGFYPVYDGIDSLALRLLLADRAEQSIDAQYFLIHDDLVGNIFIEALLRAADRGVRVRLLIDDIHTGGLDTALAALDSHENFEVRLFNPFAHRKRRGLDVTRMNTVTRRMHNKSFTVDNQIVLIGGRNIADEYFDAKPGEKFGDLDVLAIGSVVPKVTEMFDSYWNHPASLPMPALANAPEADVNTLEVLEERIDRALEDVATSEYADAVNSSILDYVQTDKSAFTWAEYSLVYDSPDKSNPDADIGEGSIVVQMRESIGEIQEELIVASAYFVLRKDNIEAFRRLRERGVKVLVLTNSLASNNHSVSHSGYAAIRKQLLEMGVNLYEVRANTSIPADVSAGVQEAKSTLHAKAFVVDRQRVYIGSFNWNQRSLNLDTELGVIIYSPELATRMLDRVNTALPAVAFEVFLDEKDRIRWRYTDNCQEVIVSKEPQSGFWRRFSAGFMRMLPIKSQL